jgi:SPP1 gp7 family putative phage head morphogenesis protein
MEIDLLTEIRDAVDRAIAEGVTFQEFYAGLAPLLRSRGWWGRRWMIDPQTGRRVKAQLGSRRRLSIIFDTNMRMAYAHGRWRRIERLAERRPWLRYVAVLDERTREDHRRWHGTVLRWDDPWWNTHHPPNGWRCRCTVQQLSERDLSRWGYEPSGTAPPLEARPWHDTRRGTIEMIPSGIDPGFAYNPGRIDRLAEAEQRLAEKQALRRRP